MPTPVTIPDGPRPRRSPHLEPGAHLGPYHLLEILGEGGMGRVFRAQQDHPVKRQVALKILKVTLDSDALRARFDVERQAMGRLDHPNIGKLFEAGTTEQGLPFFVMELIDGQPITRFCDRHRMTIADRLELFAEVCRGTAHAHSRLILHRDLKPSNILVSEVDGRAFPKIIDFGVAKGLGESLANASLATGGGMIGTPTYMSPEAMGIGGEVDTRSDVFSLGVLLYNLISGRLPWSGQGQSLAAVLNERMRTEAARPSTHLSENDAASIAKIARRRGLAGDELERTIAGDLDWIVMKAIADDPEERYPSAAELGNEIDRYLDQRPVSARPPTTTYLLAKFARRHRTAVVAAAVALGAVGLGILGTTAGMVRANREAVRAGLQAEAARQALSESKQVSDFLVDLFEVADPEKSTSAPVDLREMLARGVDQLRIDLAEQPLVRARFLHTIGKVYTRMAMFDDAGELVAEALELREREYRHQPDHPERLASLGRLAIIRRRQGRLDEAEELARRVLGVRLQGAQTRENQLELAVALNGLGNILWSRGEYREAEEVYRRALSIREQEVNARSPELAESLNNLGALYQSEHRYREAFPLLARASDIFEETLGPSHPSFAAGLLNQALVLQPLARWQEAEDLLRRTAVIWRASYGREHPRTIRARNRLATLLRRQERFGESIEIYRENLQVVESVEPVDDRTRAGVLTGLGISLAHHGELGQAKECFDRALAIYQRTYGEHHLTTINGRSNLAWLAHRQGLLAEAEKLHREVLDIRQERDPRDARTAWTLHHLSLVVADLGREHEGQEMLRRAIEIRRERLGESHFEVAASLHVLAGLVANHAPSEAHELYVQALEIRRQSLPADHPETERTRTALEKLGERSSSTQHTID